MKTTREIQTVLTFRAYCAEILSTEYTDNGAGGPTRREDCEDVPHVSGPTFGELLVKAKRTCGREYGGANDNSAFFPDIGEDVAQWGYFGFNLVSDGRLYEYLYKFEKLAEVVDPLRAPNEGDLKA